MLNCARWPFWAALLSLLAGCASSGDRADAATAPSPANWRSLATVNDRERIRTWRDAWVKATAQINAAGEGAKLPPLGPLMQPDAALANPGLPPGAYSCKIYKLGTRQADGPVFRVSQPFTCRVAQEGDMLSLSKLGGVQKPVGFLFPGDDSRMIFLGTMMLGDEQRALDYGRDPERDMAGALERIAPQRWRLILPFPHWESTLDVMELVPKA
ncbi:protein of unknown function [Sphingomonas laterariae]|uniref:DUF4893 domain-containing protein n=1 Tax=Edaphosphingomonas laterariae TaxID=861865 RepID=A0A239CV24_9SPHN|nr:protein of unknown function [Sphingomonas laterariae]